MLPRLRIHGTVPGAPSYTRSSRFSIPVTGGFFDVFNSITSAITDPIVNAALTATGTQKDVQNAMAYVGTQAIRVGGAALPVDNNTPSAQVANYNIEGAAVGGELAMRSQGGAENHRVCAGAGQQERPGL